MDEHDPTAEHRRAQAAQWFARLKSLPVSKGTLEDFFDWRRDPANAEAFAEAESLWHDAGRQGDSPAILRLTAEAYARAGATPRPRRSMRSLLAIGAGVLFAMLVASWWIFQVDRPQQFATLTGEQRAVALSDGSQVRLDTETRLNTRMEDDTRQIRLDQGQAMFEVAHDRARPFRVKAGDVEVEATGTKFDVRFVDGVTRVSLFEGGVDIREAGRDVIHLSPGEMWSSKATRAASITSLDVRRASAWTQGRLIFEATPLSEAISEINRYTQNKVVLGATARAREPISGSFKTGDPSGFLKAVAALLSLDFERQENGTFLLRDRRPSQI
ncbi:FecR family protein [Sphingobium cupriresistens]